MGAGGPLRVVLVDDHQVVLDGLRAMLDSYRDAVEIVGEATDPQQGLAVVSATEPDVALLDVRLRGASGLDLCSDIRERQPDCRVVFLTVYDDEQYLFQALRLGAAGFLLKRVHGRELVDHLERIADGETVIDPTLAGRTGLTEVSIAPGDFWPGMHLGLTRRESEVLALFVSGLPHRGVAENLNVSEETVKSHARTIYRKLDVPDRAGAVALVLREGVFQ